MLASVRLLHRKLLGQEVVVDERRVVGGGVVLVAVLGGDTDRLGIVDFAGPETVNRGRAVDLAEDVEQILTLGRDEEGKE